MQTRTHDLGSLEQGRSSARLAILGPIAANLGFVLELTLVPLVLPAIQAQHDVSVQDLAWVFNAYGIAVAFGVLVGGWFGDTFGARRVFGIGVVLFSAGSAFVAFTSSYEGIVIARALHGLGAGVFSPLVPLLLTRASPARPGRILIFWGSIAGYIVAFTPLLYMSHVVEFDWKVIFSSFAVIAVAAALCTALFPVPAGSAPQQESDRNFSRLLRRRPLWMTYLYVCCTYGCITFYLFQLPLWLSENAALSGSVGFAFTSLWLTYSAVSTLLRNAVDGPMLRWIMLAAPIQIAAAIPVLIVGSTTVFIILSAMLIGSGLACSNAPSTQLVLRCAPDGMQALSASLDITFARLGGFFAVGLLATAPPVGAAVVVAGLSCVAVICVWAVRQQLP